MPKSPKRMFVAKTVSTACQRTLFFSAGRQFNHNEIYPWSVIIFHFHLCLLKSLKDPPQLGLNASLSLSHVSCVLFKTIADLRTRKLHACKYQPGVSPSIPIRIPTSMRSLPLWSLSVVHSHRHYGRNIVSKHFLVGSK